MSHSKASPTRTPVGEPVAESAQPTGQTRRELLLWNYTEVSDELDAHLASEPSVG
jgi:hypothetical protein